MRKTIFLTFVYVLMGMLFSHAQTTVTKTYTGLTTIDNCGTYCSSLPGVAFTTADFPSGEIIDLEVSITWRKTDGSCASPGSGYSYHSETSFRLDGPMGTQVILATPGTWSGGANTPMTTTVFNQAATSIPSGSPVSGSFRPNNGDLSNFDASSAIGTWFLRAGDTAGGDPLCVQGYSVTITVMEDNIAPTITCPSDITENNDPGTCGAMVTVPQPTVVDCPILVVNEGNTIGGPLWDRPIGSGPTISGLGPVTYATFSFTVEEDGNYDISSFQNYDGYIHLYSGSFNPLSQLTNLLVGDDDGDGGIGTSDIDNISLSTGTTYVLVTSGFAAGDEGYFQTIISLNCPSVPPPPMKAQNYAGYLGLQDIERAKTAWLKDNVVTFAPLKPIPANTKSLFTVTNDFNGTDNASGMYPVGTTTVTWTATDIFGNTASCSHTVTVNDTEDPVITCPADITVSNDAGICGAVVSYTVDATDSCSAGVGIFDEFETGGTGWTTGSLGGANNWVIRTTSGTGTSFGANVNMYGVPHSGNGSVEYSYLQSPVFNSVGGGVFSFDFFVNNETSYYDQEIVQISYNGGSTWTQVIGPQLPNNSSTVQTTSFAIASANGTSNTVVRFIYNTVDSCCGPQDGFFVDNIEFGLTIAQTDTTGLTSGDEFPVGTTTLEYTATDIAGNTATCSFDIIVEDNEPPMAVCQDLTVELDVNGLGAITAAEINNGSSDNCDIDTIVLDITSFDCSNLGPNTVELTVTDIYGNPSTCTATVTVEDNIDPVAVCQAFTLELDTDGLGTITPADIDDGSSDNCDIDTLVLDITSFDCSNLGPNTVELTVTDTSGNTDSCTATVTVEDNIDPVAVCQAFSISLNEIGEATITAADVDGGSSDNCDIDMMTLDIYDFGCNDVGVNTVELTVTDTSGNTDSCFADVTIIDLPPIIACPSDVVADSQPGICGSEVFFADPVAIDPEGSVVVITQTMGPVSGSIFPIGETIVEFSATDFCGVNVSTCQFTVTITDVENPVAMCQDITLELDTAGMASITTADIDNGSSDNCPDFTMELDITSFGCGDVGPNTVTLTVTDASGLTDTCTATVTIEDNQAPVVICVGSGGVATEGESFEAATIPAGWTTVIEAGSWDWTFGSGAMPGTDDFPTNAAIFDDDAAGPDVNHARLLSPVVDLSTAAAASVSFDYALGDFAGSGKLTVEMWDGAAWQEIFVADDADIPPTNTGVLDVLAYANAAAQLRFSYDDENGGWNWGAGIDNLEVMYDLPPTPPLEVVLDPDGMVTVDAMDLLFDIDDNCGTIATFGSGGGVSGSLTSLFAAGNNGSPGGAVYFDITVGPSDINVTSIDINTADAGAFTMDVYALMGTYVGNEGNAAAWGTPTNASGTGAGLDMPSNAILDTPLTLTAGATYGMALVLDATHAHHYTNGDGSNENFSNADMSMQLGAASNVPFDGSPFAPRVFNGTINYSAGGGTTMDLDCSNLGENMIDVTVTDAGGNEATCTATVIVLDETAPVLLCEDKDIELGPDGTTTIDPYDLMANLPSTYEVMVIGSDNASGTEGFTDFTVDITDAASISFDWDYTLNDIPGYDSFGYLLNGVYTELTDPLVGNQSGTGALAVVAGDVFGFRSYTTDNSFGNNETLITNFMPGFSGQFDPANWELTLLNSDGNAYITEIPGGLQAYDACGIDVIIADVTEVSCADIGTPILVTVFANDESGNFTSCQATINVVDLMAPTLTCHGNTTAPFDPATGLYELPDYIALGDTFATDNCTEESLIILTQTPAPGTQMPATGGTPHIISFTAEDEYGNIATCEFELLVDVVGVQENEILANALVMYPNPATNQVTLVNSSAIVLEAAIIYDINGKLVAQFDLQEMQKETTLDISMLSSSVYMVKIIGENASTVKRLIKE